MTMKQRKCGLNQLTFLLIESCGLTKKKISGKWERQVLAGRALNFLLILVQKPIPILRVNRKTESTFPIDLGNSGILFSFSTIVMSMVNYILFPRRMSTQVWDLSGLLLSCRGLTPTTKLTSSCLFLMKLLI